MTISHVMDWLRGRSDTAVARPGEEPLTRAQILARVERGANRRLGMSAAEMVSAYRAGSIGDAGEICDLLALTELLPENDPLFHQQQPVRRRA